MFPNGGTKISDEEVYLFDNLEFEMQSGLFTPTVDELEISPNPVHNMLFVRNPGDAQRFVLFNSLGQPVKGQYSNGNEIVSIIVNDLPEGVYLLGAYDTNGRLIANSSIVKH
jgi:hypothetical protein